jgi:hypothetical protein
MTTTNVGITTHVFADTGDYFAAHLDTGGIRIGLRPVMCFNIPPHHALYEACSKATTDTVEAVFDKLYAVLQSPVKTQLTNFYG